VDNPVARFVQRVQDTHTVIGDEFAILVELVKRRAETRRRRRRGDQFKLPTPQTITPEAERALATRVVLVVAMIVGAPLPDWAAGAEELSPPPPLYRWR
jgi:hypothetical protein